MSVLLFRFGLGGGIMEKLTEWKDDKKLLAKTKFSGDFGSANVIGRLAEYEDLEERLGVPLEELAKLCDKHIPKDCQNPNKAIVLTDEDVDRWNEYKNAEEQGLLLRLPCKVGDIVYSINHNEKHGVTPVIVVEIKFSATGLTNKPYIKIICSDSDLRTKCCKEYDGNDFGKTVFLTQSEAEQKLKEMESD